MAVDNIHHTHVLYLDLEWTCWDAPPPPGMQQEIIEIGIVEMDLLTLNITQEASYFVRPRRWEISPKCAKLTGITTEDIQKANPLDEVLSVLTKKFRPANKPCCTWGDDVSVIAGACASLGLISPFRRPIDLSKVFHGVYLSRRINRVWAEQFKCWRWNLMGFPTERYRMPEMPHVSMHQSFDGCEENLILFLLRPSSGMKLCP